MRIAAESQTSLVGHPTRSFLPTKVTDVPKDLLRSYPHTKRVGNYLLGRTLGEGSFAKVKEGLHALTGEKVAVKVIDKKKAREDAYVRKNLRREGKLLQMVRHPHVVQLYEILETENSYYLVTELCKGGDLMDYICNQKRLDEKEARKFIRHVLSAVNYMHKVGILHRDLKVENLLLDENKNIKIIDFGLSNAVRVSHTNEGSSFQEFCVTQCGSPAYAAPELLGNKKYGPKVDVWSIGVNLYAMLTGNLPFTVEPFNIKALYQKMLDGNMNPIPDHISSGCRNLLKAFLIPDPDRRISLQEAMEHPWITNQSHDLIDPIPFPNRLVADELDSNVVRHMSEFMDFRMSEVIRLVTSNIPNNATATYHLMLRKLKRYMVQERAITRESIHESKISTTSKQSVHKTPSDTKVTPGQVIELLPINDNKKTTATSDTKVNEHIMPKSPARAPSVANSPRLARRRQQKASLHQNDTEMVAKQPVITAERDDVQVIRIVSEGNQRHHGLAEAAPPSRVRLLSPRIDRATNSKLDSPSTATELPDIHLRDHSPSSDVSDGRSNHIAPPTQRTSQSKLSPGADRHQWIPSLTSKSSSTQSVVSSTSRRSTLSNGRDVQQSKSSEKKVQPGSFKQRHSVPHPANDINIPENQRRGSHLSTVPPNVLNSNTAISQPDRSRRFSNLGQVDSRQHKTSPSRLSPSVPRRRESFEGIAPVDATALAVITDRSTESRLGNRPILRRGSMDMHSPIMKRKSMEKLLNMNNLPGGHIQDPSIASINSKDMKKPLPAISPPLTGRKFDQ